MSNGLPEKFSGWFVFIFLAVAVFLSYFPAFSNGFTNWDDQVYVLNNTAIHSISIESIKNLFSHFLIISYHPLTLLSLQVNYYFSGTNAFGYIFTNVLFHFMNSFLVF